MKRAETDNPRADEIEKAAWLHQKMADDLRAQAAQLRYSTKSSGKLNKGKGDI